MSRALVGGRARDVREVEAQPVRRDERSLLAHVRAQPLAQRGVQQVRGRVIAARRVAPRRVHGRRHPVAGRELCLSPMHEVRAHVAGAAAPNAGDVASRPFALVSVPVSDTWPPDST